MNKEKYTYRVMWSDPDNAYIGTVAGFPSLSHVNNSQIGTFCEIVDLGDSVLVDIEENDEMIPVPLGR